MRLASDVYQVVKAPGGNIYLLEEEEGITLIDSGLPGAARRVLEYLRALGRSPEELRRVLLTHGHPDHYGGAALLQRETGAQVFLHRADVFRDRRGRLRAGTHSFLLVPSPRVDGFLEEGDYLPLLGGLRVLHIPGHTPGSLAFYLEKRGLLFTGDTLLSDGKVLKGPLPLPGTDLLQYRHSLLRLAGVPFEGALPGHGRPLLRDGSRHLGERVGNGYRGLLPWWSRFLREVPDLSRLFRHRRGETAI